MGDRTIPYQVAAEHLARHDRVLMHVIARAGICTISPHKNYYAALADSIISQQLSVKAAATIERRFCELFGNAGWPSPEQILSKDIEELRSAGLSRGKATYIRDLAAHMSTGRLDFTGIEDRSNQEIIALLTDVKGIGEWTAHMFLIFCLGRTDVLAVGDLGVRSAIRKLYSLEELPSPKEVSEIAAHNHWAPYESVACWYLWYSLDNKSLAPDS